MLEIEYIFHFESGTEERFGFCFDAQSMEPAPAGLKDMPEWTRLDFHQCPHCPLTVGTHAQCPPAAQLSEVFPRLGALPSYETTLLEVITEERTITQKTTLQNAMRSLIGLIMGTSDCPYMKCFRPMARFHLPLSSEIETIFRATSTHLLSEYFNKINSKRHDFSMDGLVTSYQNVQTVNISFAARMRASGVINETNAISQLYTQSEDVPLSIKESLRELSPLFEVSQ